MPAISWTPNANATVNGSGVITKVSGSNDTPNAGAVATVAISGDGWAEVAIDSLSEVNVGLSASSTFSTNPSSYPYMFECRPSGTVNFRELGSYVGEHSYTAGQKVKFERVGTTIKFYVNGVLRFTSSTPSTGDLYIQVQILDVGVTASGGVISEEEGGGGSIDTLPAPSAIAQTSAPTSYPTAITHKDTIDLPLVLPVAPVRGGTYIDVAFNQYNIRGTDGNTGTMPQRLNRSHRLGSSAPACKWSRDSEQIWVTTPSGAIELFAVDNSFDPLTRGRMTFIRDLTFTNEPTFSRVTPKRIYGITGYVLKEHNSEANTYTDLMDLEDIDPAYTGGALVMGGSVQSSMSNPERIGVFYGGDSQDEHFRCLVFDKGDPENGLIIDTQAGTINGVAVPGMDTFFLHAISMDLSGRFVNLYTTSGDQAAGDSQVYVWDTASGTVTEVTNAMHPFGHAVGGWQKWFNNESFGDSPYFAHQMVQRNLSDPATHSKVFNTSIGSLVYGDTHYDNANQRSDVQTPIGYSNYTYYQDIPINLNLDPNYRINLLPHGPLDSEFGLIDPNTGTVYRFGHTHANPYADDGTGASAFWYQPMSATSPNGHFIARSSNHMKTLGLDATVGEPTTLYRTDVWIVDTLWEVGPEVEFDIEEEDVTITRDPGSISVTLERNNVDNFTV